jgi:hypothetical protein
MVVALSPNYKLIPLGVALTYVKRPHRRSHPLCWRVPQI